MSDMYYDTYTEGRGEGEAPQRIERRRYIPCESLQSMGTGDLIMSCNDCGLYFSLCCQHDRANRRTKICHHWPIVFTDGACIANGRTSVARSGMGIALGVDQIQQFSLPIDDTVDPGAARTNQRAELLAAIHCLRILSELDSRCYEPTFLRHKEPETHKKQWIIATDSEYVVDGISEYFPKWRANGWRTANRTRPQNLDLFLRLHQDLEEQEEKQDIDIGFWHIRREYNVVSDALAKSGAQRAEPGSIRTADRGGATH